jgi:transposase
MVRPTAKIEIPYYPIKSISELLEEGKTHKQIADSFGVGRSTITERIQKENKKGDNEIEGICML